MNKLVLDPTITTAPLATLPTCSLIGRTGSGKAPRILVNGQLAFPKTGRTERVDASTGAVIGAGNLADYVAADGTVTVIGMAVLPAAKVKEVTRTPRKGHPMCDACGKRMPVNPAHAHKCEQVLAAAPEPEPEVSTTRISASDMLTAEPSKLSAAERQTISRMLAKRIAQLNA